MKINCLVIDDEPLARKRLRSLISESPVLECVGECKTGKEAIRMISALVPDLIFLDIKMKDMSGFDVLMRLNSSKKPVVVFVTAFDEFALKAFDYSAFDYLLKPFKKERFKKTVDRVFHFFQKNEAPVFEENFSKLLNYIGQSNSNQNLDKIKEKLPIKTGRTVSFIDVDRIKYILGSGSYIDIHTNEKVHVLRSSLNNVLIDLNNSNFKRVHRSTVVNITHIKKLIHSHYGEIDVMMNDDKLLRISHSYKKGFLNFLGL
nr:response regulator transcription factor [uncultured Psychroserpens sp.]